MISKFCHFIKISKDKYAVLNNLLFEPIIVSNLEKDAIKTESLNNFTPEEISLLYEKGILVKDEDTDEKALYTLKNYVNNAVDGGISLIYLIPSNFCNLACKYCFIGKLNKEKQVMTTKIINQISKKYYEYLKKRDIKNSTIIFYGGEPLTAFDQIKYSVKSFKKYKDVKWEFAIVTNLTLLTEEIAQFFKYYDFSVGVSIDGPKNTNDANRVFKNGVGSVYDKVVEKIELIKKYNLKLGLSITLTNEILMDSNFLNWLKNLGIKDINYNLLHYTQQSDEWKKYYDRASKFLFKSDKILSKSGIIDDRLQRKIRAFNSKEFKYNDCGAIGGHQLCFSPNGDITVCHGLWNSNKDICGNIKDCSIEDIEKSSIFKDWKTNLTINKEKCLHCPAIYICGGGCAMQSNDLFKSSKKLDRAFCVHTKYSLKKLLSQKGAE